MADHHTVLAGLIKSKAVIAQMGKEAKPLADKVDAIIAEVHRALQLRDGYKTAQTKLAALKKAADDQSHKVDAAKAKNDAAHDKHVAAAKDMEKWATTVDKWDGLKDSKNKAIADAVSRIHILALSTQKSKFQYWDDEGYQNQANGILKYRKTLPKPASSNGLPQDLGVLEGKIDALVTLLQEAAATAKTMKQLDKDVSEKTKAYDEMSKKVQPIEAALSTLIGQIAADLNAAKEINGQLDHTGSTEAYRRAADVFKDLNDAIADYDGADAKAWAAKP